MAIEVREIHIRAVVNETGERTPAGAAAENAAKAAGQSEGENTDQLISQCVEKVLEILREKMER